MNAMYTSLRARNLMDSVEEELRANIACWAADQGEFSDGDIDQITRAAVKAARAKVLELVQG